MISKLREETQQLHNEIEKDNLAALIMDHSIDLDNYKTLLLQNFVSYRVIENAVQPFLKDFGTTKSNQLEKDLKALGVDFTIVEEYINTISISNKMEALGAAYVVEGSVLGGMMIAKELKECKELSEIEEHHFFNGDRKNVAGWKNFLKQVNSQEFSEEEKLQASNKAKDTFKFFGRVFFEIRVNSAKSKSKL